ncbi:glycosyltransferase family 4 protein [Candidatus Poribacteria bacterium]
MILNAIYRRAFVKLYKNVGAILVLHNRCKKQLIDMGIEPQKIRVTTAMYEGIDESEKDSSRKTDDRVNILFMAVFLPDKGQDIVAEVGRLLVENGRNDFHIVFAGDGPLMPELKKLVAENGLSEYVDILGYVRGKERERVLTEGDIFLFPTWRSEGFPAVIIEAMGAGQVVISTPRAAIPDIIDDGETGFICNSKDPKVFYQVVKRLLDNPDLLHKMQKRAKEKAEENYEASGYMKRLEALYLSVMKSDFVA